MDNQTNTQDLIKRINSFDNHFRMSDNNRVYQKGIQQENEIKALCNQCSNDDLRTIYSQLNTNGQSSIFGEAIKAHLDTLPVVKVQSTQSKIMTFYRIPDIAA